MKPLLFCLAMATTCAASGDDSPRRVVFVGITVVDVVGGIGVPGRAVVVAGPTIEAVEPTEGYIAPAGAEIIDGAGKWLMPGLWDMHVHIDDPRILPLFLANGVTGVRDMGSRPWLLELRDDIRDGRKLGPRIVAGLYTDAKRNGQPSDRPSVETPEEARNWVRRARHETYDFIKVYTGLTPETYAALVAEARLQGLPVAGHCPEWVGASEASRLGQRSIEHCTGLAVAFARNSDEFLRQIRSLPREPHGYDLEAVTGIHAKAFEDQDPARREALIAAFVRNGTWQTPTLVSQRPIPAPGESKTDPLLKYATPGHAMIWDRMQGVEPLREQMRGMGDRARSLVRELHRAGAPLLAGTDLSVFGFRVIAGFSLHDELEELVACGLTPAEALRAATINPARYHGADSTSGEVAAGRRADLVLLDADPLADIGNTRGIAGVVAAGKWLPRAELDRMLAGVAKDLE